MSIALKSQQTVSKVGIKNRDESDHLVLQCLCCIFSVFFFSLSVIWWLTRATYLISMA